MFEIALPSICFSRQGCDGHVIRDHFIQSLPSEIFLCVHFSGESIHQVGVEDKVL